MNFFSNHSTRIQSCLNPLLQNRRHLFLFPLFSDNISTPNQGQTNKQTYGRLPHVFFKINTKDTHSFIFINSLSFSLQFVPFSLKLVYLCPLPKLSLGFCHHPPVAAFVQKCRPGARNKESLGLFIYKFA